MTYNLKQTWRWYGPEDTVSLNDVKQAGASGIVSALHHIPHGKVWPLEDIKKRKKTIEAAGLTWDVVESVPVHENIKTQQGNYKKLLENYKQSLRNLAACGIHTICYNFMPVLDWTRTQLDYEVADGSKALRLDRTDLALFDVHILKRKGAETDYTDVVLNEAAKRNKEYTQHQKDLLSTNTLMGIPGEKSFTLEELQKSIDIYEPIGKKGLRENLVFFLENIMETCEENNIKMTIHPDDPPYPILGLPRTLSTIEDTQWLFGTVENKANGLCFCAGSFGAGKDNDLVKIINTNAERIHFIHLRNVTVEADNSFYEADHLGGDNDMYSIMKALLEMQQRRKRSIPMRPDHGHQMLDDLQKTTNPGYSAIGRLRGLAELRGLELGIQRSYK